MAIHLRILSWALFFLLRLRFPPGKSIPMTKLKFVYMSNNCLKSNAQQLVKCYCFAFSHIIIIKIFGEINNINKTASQYFVIKIEFQQRTRKRTVTECKIKTSPLLTFRSMTQRLPKLNTVTRRRILITYKCVWHMNCGSPITGI